MAELFRMDFVKDYPNLPVSQAKIILVDGGTSLLSPFKEGLQSYAKEELEKRGVEVRLNTSVTGVGTENVTLESGPPINSQTVIWAGGLKVNPFANLLGVELGRGGRVPVRPDSSLAEHPEVFVVGDMAGAKDDETEEILPQLGSVAMQAGRHVGENVLHRIAGEKTTSFHYLDKGFMATIGRGAAVAQMPFGVTMKGTVAWLAWGSIHLALLTGWENRIKTTVDWFWNEFQREHASRIDIEE
jgi:NADH dehydrogenase